MSHFFIFIMYIILYNEKEVTEMIKHLYDSFAERYYHGGSIYLYSDPHFGDLDCYKIRFDKSI